MQNIIYMNKNILQEENIVLKKALQDLIDFHHHIGNEDCPYNRNYILITMYNIAEKALNNVYLIKH